MLKSFIALFANDIFVILVYLKHFRKMSRQWKITSHKLLLAFIRTTIEYEDKVPRIRQLYSHKILEARPSSFTTALYHQY